MPKIILEEQQIETTNNKETNCKTIRKVIQSKKYNINYVKVHIENIDKLLALKLSGGEYNLFIKSLEFIQFDNSITFSSKTKSTICNVLNISISSLRRLKNKLVEKNIFIKTKYKDEFIINPLFISKQNITKTMDLLDNINNIKEG